MFGPACYIADSLPVVFFLAYRYADHADAMRAALLANANSGGETCHRGSALGALIGAAVGVEGIPEGWREGLFAATGIGTEVDTLWRQLVRVGAQPASLPAQWSDRRSGENNE